MFDYIPFPVFTQTTGMTHFQEWYMLCFTTVTVPPDRWNDMQGDFCTVLLTCWVTNWTDCWLFSASFLITFLTAGIAKSIDIHVPSLLSRIVISGLLLQTIPSLHCSFHSTVTLHSVPVYTNLCTRPHKCLL